MIFFLLIFLLAITLGFWSSVTVRRERTVLKYLAIGEGVILFLGVVFNWWWKLPT